MYTYHFTVFFSEKYTRETLKLEYERKPVLDLYLEAESKTSLPEKGECDGSDIQKELFARWFENQGDHGKFYCANAFTPQQLYWALSANEGGIYDFEFYTDDPDDIAENDTDDGYGDILP